MKWPCRRSHLAIAPLLVACCGSAGAQWKPERPVELIVTAAEGGNQDLTARLIQGVWQARKIVYPLVLVNKPGGGGAIAAAYLTQHSRDPHYLMMLAPTLLTNRIMGSTTFVHSDFTPIALLFNEYVFVSVKADSPIRTGRDMIQRLKQMPDSLSIAVATAIGNHIHMGVALPMKAAGIDIKRMKVVAFKSSAQSLTALLGGHVDAAASTFAALLPYVTSGSLRIVAMSAAQRMPGFMANIPTWKEQGANAVFDSWRGIAGAKDLSEAQVNYWDAAFAALSRIDEWKADAEKNFNVIHYLNSADTRRYWDEQYKELEAALTELGLTKRSR